MSLPAPPAIVRTSISEQTYVYLRDAIIAGHLAPGQRLHLHRVCAKLKVSKMPVKEAIGRLVSEGLVEVQPRSGTFVARIDPREVAETFDLRGALEALAGELAAVRATDADLDGLEAIAHSLDETGRSGDVGRHVGANVDFHGRIIELSGNRRLAGVYRQLGAMTAVAAIHHRWQDWRTRLDQERSEHLAIVAALRARDPAAVVRATREHIVRGKAEVLAGLEAITRR